MSKEICYCEDCLIEELTVILGEIYSEIIEDVIRGYHVGMVGKVILMRGINEALYQIGISDESLEDRKDKVKLLEILDCEINS